MLQAATQSPAGQQPNGAGEGRGGGGIRPLADFCHPAIFSDALWGSAVFLIPLSMEENPGGVHFCHRNNSSIILHNFAAQDIIVLIRVDNKLMRS